MMQGTCTNAWATAPAPSLEEMAKLCEKYAPPRFTRFVTTHPIYHELLKHIEGTAALAGTIFGIPIWTYATKCEAVIAAALMQDKGERVCVIVDYELTEVDAVAFIEARLRALEAAKHA